jgi:hypothetical protein
MQWPGLIWAIQSRLTGTPERPSRTQGPSEFYIDLHQLNSILRNNDRGHVITIQLICNEKPG